MMARYVALFRGINVGGNNIVPMKKLVEVLETLGYENARTYIQSGNAVFRCSANKPADIEARIGAGVAKAFGFQPRVLVLSAADLDRAIAANPFPQAEADHKSLHFYFLTERARQPNIDALNELKSGKESFVLTERIFYLHAPDGIGKSKLAERVEKYLGVPATARNWQTVSKVRDLVASI